MEKFLAAALTTLILATGSWAGMVRSAHDGAGGLSLIIESEFSSNHWTSNETVCVEVDGKDPGKNLIRELHAKAIYILKYSDWKRNLACGFLISVYRIKADTMQFHVFSSDLREVNKGNVHFVTGMREGKYTMKLTNERWQIAEYVTEKW